MNGSTVKNHTSLKNGIRIQCNTENFVSIVVPGLSTSSSSSSHPSTSVTPSRQESHHSTSTSSSSSSPTTATSSDSGTREREDRSEIDSPPVLVSSSNVEEMIERRNPLFAADSGMCPQCKEYTSYYRKLATKTVNIQQEELQEHWRTSMRQTRSTTSTMTRTPTRARCTTCEHALRARSLRHTLMLGHMHLGSSSESRHVIHVHVRLSLSSPLALSTSICPSPSSPTSSFSCTSSSTLSSTTWSPCKTCAPPRTRGVTTPTTSPPPSQGMSPTSRPSASSTTHRFPSPTLPVIGPGHRRRYTRQAAHRGIPRTCRLLRSRRHVSQSVVVVCCVR